MIFPGKGSSIRF